ncbi:MAG: hypothetical protein JSR36_03280 [Proteobacteria bacterium]|nr:hypothetical protein [Pseudomonadota bacterium]
MIKTFTLVRKKPGLTDQQFFERWTEHTRDWDLRDHPDILLNRLALLKDNPQFTGIAENHWPDRAALDAAAAWYATPAGQSHWADLCSFMDIDNSPTVIVESEALVSAENGIALIPFPAA